MPRIDIAAIEPVTGSGYPAPYAAQMGERSFRSLGDAVGLTQFGVNLFTMEPGATSSLRHWHEAEDEFVWVVSGELVLTDESGETLLRAGDCAGFRAGEPNGHHLQNRSGAQAQFLVVGTRAPRERCVYPDVDLIYHAEGGRDWFTLRDGTAIK